MIIQATPSPPPPPQILGGHIRPASPRDRHPTVNKLIRFITQTVKPQARKKLFEKGGADFFLQVRRQPRKSRKLSPGKADERGGGGGCGDSNTFFSPLLKIFKVNFPDTG